MPILLNFPEYSPLSVGENFTGSRPHILLK